MKKFLEKTEPENITVFLGTSSKSIFILLLKNWKSFFDKYKNVSDNAENCESDSSKQKGGKTKNFVQTKMIKKFSEYFSQQNLFFKI